MRTLYITDLDGTLLNGDGVLSARTIEILQPLLANGLQLAVATARSPATAVELLRPLQLKTPAILMTGLFLYDLANTRPLYVNQLQPQAALSVCTALENLQQEALCYCMRGDTLTVYYKEIACEFERAFIAQRLGSPYKTFCATTLPYQEAMKGSMPLMFLVCAPTEADAQRVQQAVAHIPDIQCYYYPDEYNRGGCTLEIYPKHVSKAEALRRLRNLVSADRIVAFGDNINDLPLFAASDICCAVANARAEVLAAATHIIDANTADGVANFIAQDFTPTKENS